MGCRSYPNGYHAGRMRRFATLLTALVSGWVVHGADVVVRIEVAPGLKYDPERFAVAPGDHVTVEFHNGDEMIHNFVVTAPGKRLKVVSAALELGSSGPGRNFVPDLKDVLWSTRALNPNETTTLSFTAPEEEGVYPYVCTFPGHGFLMYGAMYVTRHALTPIESDPNIPRVVSPSTAPRDGLLQVGDRPIVSRTFLPDCGPAAIAVGMPGGQAYCFDAGSCRLRYVWKGGFVDNTDQWAGKGDLWSKVVGRIYYRTPAAPWLRFGDAAHVPSARWRGYRLVDGYPQFIYTLDGAETHELIRPVAGGVEIAYEIPSAPGPVFFVTDADGGASVASSAGTWSGATLSLTAAEAARFTITLTERPKIEPLAYWSMNDALWGAEVDPKPGVVGRAFTPGGLERTPHVLDTGIKASALSGGGTLMAWVKTNPGGPDFAPVFSAGSSFIVPAPRQDGRWHHLVITCPPRGGVGRRFVDGVDEGPEPLRLPSSDPPFEIGSEGGRFLAGLLDEVRIYDRVLPAPEIESIYRREAREGGLLPQ
jgi:plastocyanin